MSIPSKLHLSELAPHVIQSEIRAMTAACTAAHGINLAQGVCDTDPPLAVVNAAIEAAKSGHNTYSRHEGIDRLRDAIAAKFAAFNRLSVDPAREVLVTSGATGAMNAAIMALLDPGDACLVFEPFYGYHLATLRTQRITPIVVPLDAPGWEMDVERLRSAVTPRTRAIIVNTPSNPSGKVFSLHDLQAIADVAIEHDLFVFTDEMYEYFLYDRARHISLASLEGMRERTITISGFSKTFSVTGWRLGYLSADPRWLPAIGHFHDLTYVCAPTPLQYGVAAGLLTLPPTFYSDLATEYQGKRDSICAALEAAGLVPSVPAGAYYVLADATNVQGTDAPAKARQLLAETGLAAVAGSAFFAEGRGDHLLRFCFAKKADVLDEACRRLRAWRA